MKKPVADQTNIKRVAEMLINLNGSTTTKEVKDQLRTEGFWAEQSQISSSLQQIANSENYHIEVDTTTHAGVSFNRYSQPKKVQPATNVINNASQNGLVLLDIIDRLFSIDCSLSETFQDVGIDSSSALQLVIGELESDLNLDKSKFVGTDFEPAALIVWRQKTLNELALLVDTLTQTNVSTLTPTQTKQSKPRKPKQKVTATPLFVVPTTFDNKDIFTNYNRLDWIVSCNGNDKCIFQSTESRDHVRSAYATKYKTRIQKVRARRVVNII